MGPARLLELIRDRDPCEVWCDVVKGRIPRKRPLQPDLLGGTPGPADGSWAAAASRLDAEAWWSRASARGVMVTWLGRHDYPPQLAGDPLPPGVLFWRGSLAAALERPRVAVVGTRSASPEGRAVAYQMGRDLVSAGACVISGLALGIDGSAHRGALSAVDDAEGAPTAPATVGVAASGVDVPYPRRHAALWEAVASAGAVISETPPGYPAQAWRFPARNRVIAGLSQLVVVVESHETGGSLITSDAAIERGIEVRVVPGPVNSPSCAGSNQLLYEGAGPVRCARDVLDALGMLVPEPPGAVRGRRRRPGEGAGSVPLTALPPPERAVLAALGWVPVSINTVAERSALSVGQVAAALEGLAARGLVADDRGWWTRTR